MSETTLLCRCGNRVSKICIHALCGYCCFDKKSCPKHRLNQRQNRKHTTSTTSSHVETSTDKARIDKTQPSFEIESDVNLAQLQSIVYESNKEIPFAIVQFIIGEYLDTRQECGRCGWKIPESDIEHCTRCTITICDGCRRYLDRTNPYCDECYESSDSEQEDDDSDNDDSETEYEDDDSETE